MIAAERVFARDGYDGASMRNIAAAATVSQALLHYHFGTKARLFDEIFVARSDQINGRRAAMLDGLSEAGRVPLLDEVIEALFRPTFEFGHDPSQPGNFFSRILANTALSDDPHHRALIKEHYDPIAEKFITVFRTICPGLSWADAVWAYMFAIGVGMTMMAPTGRPARLSGEGCDDRDIEALLGRIRIFVRGGIEQLDGT